MYIYGYAIAKNENKGIELIERSGELEYLPAQMYLGKYYLDNKKNLENSLYWFKKAAALNNVDAQVFTALAYYNGYGTKKDVNVAKKYIIK